MGDRVTVILACSECDARNYKTSKRTEDRDRLELKKFCPKCNRHTIHRETK